MVCLVGHAVEKGSEHDICCSQSLATLVATHCPSESNLNCRVTSMLESLLSPTSGLLFPSQHHSKSINALIIYLYELTPHPHPY